MTNIIYNNIDSRQLGLVIENYPTIPTANEDFDTFEIPGGESLSISKGFKDLEIPFDFVYQAENEEFYNKKTKIDSWLSQKVNQDLEYSRDKTRYYKAKKVSISATKTTSETVRRFTATFTIEALKYLKEGKIPIEFLLSGQKLYNERANYKESFPTLKIYGTDGTININDIAFTLNNIDQYVTIDSKMKLCYKDNVNKGRYMTGDYPVFFNGENNISWSGNITKIEITPNWRCY